jgi:8-oxo-dGTP pyrophosphatase MutT (NUDIX family)
MRRREFQEETGYRCQSLKLLTAFLVANVPYSPPIWLTIFWARYDGLQKPVCGEGQAVEFVSRTAATAHAIPDYLLAVWDLAIDDSRREHASS